MLRAQSPLILPVASSTGQMATASTAGRHFANTVCGLRRGERQSVACKRVRTFARMRYPHSAAQIIFKSGVCFSHRSLACHRGQREKGFRFVESKPVSVAVESAKNGKKRRHPCVWAPDLVPVKGRQSPSAIHSDRAGRSTAFRIPHRLPRFVLGDEWTLTVRHKRARQRKSHRCCFRMTAR